MEAFSYCGHKNVTSNIWVTGPADSMVYCNILKQIYLFDYMLI